MSLYQHQSSGSLLRLQSGIAILRYSTSEHQSEPCRAAFQLMLMKKTELFIEDLRRRFLSLDVLSRSQIMPFLLSQNTVPTDKESTRSGLPLWPLLEMNTCQLKKRRSVVK
jgi:hypothetical protein